MDVALVEHAEHDVHGDERGEDEQRLIGERGLEGLRGALKARADRGRQANRALRPADGGDGVAEGDAGRQVERQRDRGELALVVDGERRRTRGQVCEGAQRHLGAGGGLHVDRLERLGVLLKARGDLEDHVVLIELGEDRRDLALAEGVVEGVVDGLGQDGEARGEVAVDDQRGHEAAVLLVARHVAQLRESPEPLDEPRGPLGELPRVRVLEGILVLRAAHAILDGQVLHRLHVEGDPLHVLDRRAESADDGGGIGAPRVPGLEIDLDAPAVRRHVGPVHADERRQALDVGILQDDAREHLLALRHRRERHRRRRLRDAEDDPRVGDGEESLRHHHVEGDGQHQGGHGDDERRRLVAQDPGERPAIGGDDALEHPLAPQVEAGALARGIVPQELGAHHRGQRQRDDGGDQDGDAERDGELAEEPPHDVTHEEERDQHGDERDGQRDDREADLLRALEGRRERGLAGLDVARDVLDHHDGIVHDEARRDGEGHQREVVEAVAQEVHDAEGAHDRDGHGDARDDGGGEAAQEQEHDHDDEPHREHQRELDVFHGGPDRGRPIGERRDLDGGRQRGAELGQELLDAVHHVDDIGARLALDVHDHRRLVVHPRRLLHVLGAVHHVGDVGEAHGGAVLVGDDEGAVLGGREELIVGADAERLPRPFEAALGLVHVGLAEHRAHVLEAEAVGRELRRVHLHADGRLLAAADRHQADARELGDLLRQVGIGEVLDLGEGQGIGGEGERQDRRVRRVDLAVDRRARQIAGQEGARHVDRGLDLLLGHVDLVLERELQRDERRAEGAGGGHLPESRQLAELTLERRRHRRDHHVGARARVEGQDLDRRVVDLRQG